MLLRRLSDYNFIRKLSQNLITILRVKRPFYPWTKSASWSKSKSTLSRPNSMSYPPTRQVPGLTTYSQLSRLAESLYRLVEFNLSYHRDISTLLVESLLGLVEFFSFQVLIVSNTLSHLLNSVVSLITRKGFGDFEPTRRVL